MKKATKEKLSKDIEKILIEHSSPAIMTPQLKGQKVILLEWGQLTPQLIGDIINLFETLTPQQG